MVDQAAFQGGTGNRIHLKMFSSLSSVFAVIFILENLLFLSNADRFKSPENKLKSSNKKPFDKRVSYPWTGDLACQQFSVQVNHYFNLIYLIHSLINTSKYVTFYWI